MNDNLAAPLLFRALFFLAALCILAAAACVSSQQEAYVEARRAYEACLDFHPEDADRCETERVAAMQRAKQYDEDARRATGCSVNQSACEIPR